MPAAAQHADLKEFVPKGQSVVSRINTDITGDGVPDTVFVSTDTANFQAKVMVLTRLAGKSVDGKGQMQGLQAIDSLELDLSPHGPPSLAVKNGVLLVHSTVGGNSVKTTATYRYRLDAEEGRMRLIGLDAERTASEAGVKFSWNVLTGQRIVRHGKRDPAAFVYGPELRSTVGADKVYMAQTPSADDLLDELVEKRRKR